MALLVRDKQALAIEAIRKCGWQPVLLGSAKTPMRVSAVRGDQSLHTLIYMWGLTPGGRPSLKDEYRIQVQVDEFRDSPPATTVVLGWWAEGGVFAAFDVEKHRGPLGDNSSIQVSLSTLRNAAKQGFDVSAGKENGEVVAAFRPEYFIAYMEHARSIHSGRQEIDLLRQAVNPHSTLPVASSNLPPKRQMVLRLVSARVRASNFREKVLRAYDHKCAFCGVQLDLVEAAHIVPVASEHSTDETKNGISLCVLHHRAYDSGLVTLLPSFEILLDKERLESLIATNRGAGHETFEDGLLDVISVPPNPADHPSKVYVETGNKLRGWRIAS